MKIKVAGLREKLSHDVLTKYIIPLIRDKRVQLSDKAFITCGEELQFTISYVNNETIIDFHNVKPVAIYKGFFTFEPDIIRIRIGTTEVNVELERSPDLRIVDDGKTG